MPQTIEELRAAMNAAKLTGKGNYLPVGSHRLRIEKFFFKAPGQNSPMGLFIAELKAVRSTNPDTQIEAITYSESFDPAKSGWMERMKKFLLASLGVDWRGAVPPDANDLVADIRFACEYASERATLTQKYGRPPEEFLIGRLVAAESAPYHTKSNKDIVANTWNPAPAA